MLSEVLIYATRTIWFHSRYRYVNNPDIIQSQFNLWIEHLNKLFNNQIPQDINSVILECISELKTIQSHHVPFDLKNGFLNA